MPGLYPQPSGVVGVGSGGLDPGGVGARTPGSPSLGTEWGLDTLLQSSCYCLLSRMDSDPGCW